MGRNKLNSGDGEGFLRAFWDAWRDLELEEKVVVSADVHLTPRKGVLSIVLMAYEEVEEGTERVAGRYLVEYPSSAVSTLEATLYQALVRLERIVVDGHRWPSGRG